MMTDDVYFSSVARFIPRRSVRHQKMLCPSAHPHGLLGVVTHIWDRRIGAFNSYRCMEYIDQET